MTTEELPDTLRVKFTCGFDGNGQNACYRSCKNVENFIFGGCRIISIHDADGKVLYLEKSLGVDTGSEYVFLIFSHSVIFSSHKRN